MEDVCKNMSKSFTTNEKGWKRSLEVLPSRRRAIKFVEHLKAKNLVSNISHETLVFEFIDQFGSNEHRTLDRYLGRVAWRQLVKPKSRKSFFIMYPPKRGLLEILGLVVRNGEKFTIVKDSPKMLCVRVEGGDREGVRGERERTRLNHPPPTHTYNHWKKKLKNGFV